MLVKVLVVTFYVCSAAQICTLTRGERILAIAPVGGKSHWNLMQGVLRALTDHGHHVTAFTPFPDGDRENYTEIDLSKDIKTFLKMDIDLARELFVGHTNVINFVHDTSRMCCKTIYANDVIKNIIENNNGSDYDVIFAELMASECIGYLAGRLNVPLVYVTPPPIITYVERSVSGHYPNPAAVSNTEADHGVPRTFGQRVANTMSMVYTTCLLRYRTWFASVSSDRQPFDLAEPVKPALIFTNAHYITDAPRPLPPNVVPIGGIHLLSPPRKIPDDILEFIDNSPNGVIIFTLGSVVAISSLPERIQDAIITVLGHVSQKVLLKYEDDVKINLPKNIMTKKWLPQKDIIVHPNIKIFISHGGISGVYEAVDAGVPVLGFPIFFDQSRNLKNLVDAGMAISMDLEALSKDTFMKAILKLVNDKSYMINAKKASEIFKDRPMSPAQSVDYWTRYVVRHKGAPHLKSQALNLTWYQYFLLDVIAVLLLLLVLIIYIPYKLLRSIHIYNFLKVKSAVKNKSE